MFNILQRSKSTTYLKCAAVHILQFLINLWSKLWHKRQSTALHSQPKLIRDVVFPNNGTGIHHYCRCLHQCTTIKAISGYLCENYSWVGSNSFGWVAKFWEQVRDPVLQRKSVSLLFYMAPCVSKCHFDEGIVLLDLWLNHCRRKSVKRETERVK